MKILIIGGTGFIGKQVTQMFVQNGHEVAVFHRNKETSDPSLNTIEIIGTRDKILNYKNEFLWFVYTKYIVKFHSSILYI